MTELLRIPKADCDEYSENSGGAMSTLKMDVNVQDELSSEITPSSSINKLKKATKLIGRLSRLKKEQD